MDQGGERKVQIYLTYPMSYKQFCDVAKVAIMEKKV